MTGMTIADAVKACGGKYIGTRTETTELGRVVIDSRVIEPGDLFVAYKGEKRSTRARHAASASVYPRVRRVD